MDGSAPDEDIAAYIELIRSELALAADTDPVAEVAARLSPAEPRDRPPAKAPAVVRLGRTVWSLRRRRVPAASLDVLQKDLGVLKLFDPNDAWSPEALNRLMSDVHPKPKRTRRRANAPPSEKVVPIKPREGR